MPGSAGEAIPCVQAGQLVGRYANPSAIPVVEAEAIRQRDMPRLHAVRDFHPGDRAAAAGGNTRLAAIIQAQFFGIGAADAQRALAILAAPTRVPVDGVGRVVAALTGHQQEGVILGGQRFGAGRQPGDFFQQVGDNQLYLTELLNQRIVVTFGEHHAGVIADNGVEQGIRRLQGVAFEARPRQRGAIAHGEVQAQGPQHRANGRALR